MTINSQYLLFYVDELIKVHWVDWSERYLSDVPAKEYLTKRGFQDIAGSESSSTRTRALDCFKLGFIHSKLVASRTGGADDVPNGWMSICNNESIHTSTGYFAYILGRALRSEAQLKSTEEALNSFCSLLILTIGFQYQNRWYSTVNIFLFIKRKIEIILDEEIHGEEIRLLAGAVFNTIECGYVEQLIDAYRQDNAVLKLCFKFRESNEIRLFSLEEFREVCKDKGFNINSTERHKACLFWGNSERGIFSRAMSSFGKSFLIDLSLLDQELCQKGLDNIFCEYYEDIERGRVENDIIAICLRPTILDHNVKNGVLSVMKSLSDGVIDALALIKNEAAIKITDKFYLHDEIEVHKATESLKVSIPYNDLPLQPEVGNILILLNGDEFKIKNIELIDGRYFIQCQRIALEQAGSDSID